MSGKERFQKINRKNLVLQGGILAAAGLVTKVIGFIYRIPMANIIGNEGNGLYSVAFGIYNIALTLSSYSMPLAISKLMSARLARGDEVNAHRLYRDAYILAHIVGGLAFLLLFLGADRLALVYQKPGLERPLRVLAPTVFVVAILGSCRGYFQAHRNMVPTAASQIIEQIVNAIVSVAAASYFVRAAFGEAGAASPRAAYGAMGGTLGTLAGASAALLMFLALMSMERRRRRAREPQGADVPLEGHGALFRAIALTMLPVILSQTIYQLGYTVDDLVFGNLMLLRGYDKLQTTSLQGVFNTQYNQMVNLPVAIATAMASATLPSIVASHTRGEMGRVREKVDSVLKVNMLIAIPAAAGLAALAEPIMGVLFPRLGEYMPVAVMLLRTGSVAVIFYALSTLTTSILQGCDQMRVPVIHSGISLLIHIAIIVLCIMFTDLGVYALVVGNVTFPLCVCVMNCQSVARLIEYRFHWRDTFLKPLAASAVMGVAAASSYAAVRALLGGLGVRTAMLVAMVAAFIVALIVYALLLYLLRALTREELRALPVIGRRFR